MKRPSETGDTPQRLYFAFPGKLETASGGYGYDRRIIAGLESLGWQVELVGVGDGFPFPSPETLAAAQARLEALPDNALLVVDGLAYGVLEAAAQALHGRVDIVALVHHPLCRENGLTPAQTDRLEASEAKALSFAAHVIVTSPATATQVAELFGVGEDRLSVVLPGTDKPPFTPRHASGSVKLLSVGTVVPRKGYDLLFEALAGLLSEDWQLDIIGGTTADASCYEALQAQVRELRLDNRIAFLGTVEPDHLPHSYSAADVFVLASRYEGYGMAYTEALAHGLPVIGSGGGAVRDTLPERAAIYCGIEDVEALRNALQTLLTEPAKRLAMSQAARIAAADLPDWSDAAGHFSQLLKKVQT